MRRVSVAAIAVVFAIALAQTASAADLPVKAPRYAPPPPAPVYNWTGWYAGLNAGGGWESGDIDNISTLVCILSPELCPLPIPGQFDTDPSGFIGGGQLGYNYQFAPHWVAGLETDFQGADIKGNANVTNAILVPNGAINAVTGTANQKLDWFGTLRGRLGWLPINPLLVYATGGLAYGHVQTDISFLERTTFGALRIQNGAVNNSQSNTRAGWTVGGGLEWMFAPRWSLKAEYLYYDLGTVTLNTPLAVLNLIAHVNEVANIQSVAHYKGNIARAGVNYKF